MKGGQIPLVGGRKYGKKGGQIVTLGGGQCGPMSGGSFAELGGSARLTDGMKVMGAGEIATGGKLDPISANASPIMSGGLETMVVTEGMDMMNPGDGGSMSGGGKRKGRKRMSQKRRSSSSRKKGLGKFKSMGNDAPLNHSSMHKSDTLSSQCGGRRKRSSRKHKRSSGSKRSSRKHKRSSRSKRSSRKHKRSSRSKRRSSKRRSTKRKY